MAVDLQRAQGITVNLNGLPTCGTCCKYSINRPATVWYSRLSSSGSGTYCTVLQRHMAIDRP